jgi:hypothetical protein
MQSATYNEHHVVERQSLVLTRVKYRLYGATVGTAGCNNLYQLYDRLHVSNAFAAFHATASLLRRKCPSNYTCGLHGERKERFTRSISFGGRYLYTCIHGSLAIVVCR